MKKKYDNFIRPRSRRRRRRRPRRRRLFLFFSSVSTQHLRCVSDLDVFLVF